MEIREWRTIGRLAGMTILLLLLPATGRADEIVSYTHRPYRLENGGTKAVPGEVVTLGDLLTGTKWLTMPERKSLLQTLSRLPEILHLPDAFPAVRMWGAAFGPFLETARQSGIQSLSSPPWPERLAEFPSFHLKFFLLLRRNQPIPGATIPFPEAQIFQTPFLPAPALERPAYGELAVVRDVTPLGWTGSKRLLHGDLLEDALIDPARGPFLALSQRLATILSALARNPRPELLDPEERASWAAGEGARKWRSSRAFVSGKNDPPSESIHFFCQALLSKGWRIEIDDVRRFANLADLVFIDGAGIRHDVATPLWIDTGIPVKTGADRKTTLRIPMPHTHLTLRFLDPKGKLRATVIYYYGWWGGPTFLPQVHRPQDWIGHRVARRYRSKGEVLKVAGAIDSITFRIGRLALRLGGSRASHGHGNLGTCLRPSALVEQILHPAQPTTFYPLIANPALDPAYGKSSRLARAVQMVRRVGDDVVRPLALDDDLRRRIGASLPVERIEELLFPRLAHNLKSLNIRAIGEIR